MNKKIAVVLLIVVLAAFAAMRLFSPGPDEAVKAPSAIPEHALPAPSADAQYALVKLANPDLAKGKLLSLADIMPKLLEDEDFMGDYGSEARGLEETFKSLSKAADLLDIAKDAALLVVSDDDFSVYLSFLPDPEKFNEFVSGDGRGLYSVNVWSGHSAEGAVGAWTIDVLPAFSKVGSEDKLYMVRTGREKSPVLIAGTEGGIELMRGALDGSKPRMEVKRFNDAPDYIQGGAKVSVKSSDEKKPSVLELAWREDDDGASLQFYSDALTLMGGSSVPRSSAEGGDLPVVGKGELAMTAVIDIPYLCYLAFPMADDPIAEVMIDIGDHVRIPANYRSDIEALIRDSRLYAMVVMDGVKENPNTAYLLLETKAKSVVDKYYGLASLLLPSVKLEGWDSAFATDIDMDFMPVLARRGDYVALGIAAKPEDYSINAAIPKGMENSIRPSDLMSLSATAAFMDAGGGSAGQSLRDLLFDGDLPVGVIEALGLSRISSLQFRMTGPENAELSVFWDKEAPKKSEEASAR